MSDLQVFLVLSSIVLTTLALGYVSLALTAQFRATVRIKFTRQESGVCSERVLFPDFNKDMSLPENEQTIFEFTPTQPGEYDFHCQMGILHGTLIVK